MIRVFTKTQGRYKEGTVLDRPIVWWRNWFPNYKEITRPLIIGKKVG